MKTQRSPFFIGMLLAFLPLSACSKFQEASSDNTITVRDGKILIDPSNTEFLSHLHSVQTGNASKSEQILKTVGRMVALANSTDSLDDKKISWVELDPEVSNTLALKLPSSGYPIGYAFGATSISPTYAAQIHIGDQVLVSRYGLGKGETVARIRSITQSARDETLTVVFGIPRGSDLYPGTSCEVEFPLVKGTAFSIPVTALLHDGLKEYVLQEVERHSFVPREVNVVDENLTEAYALGSLHPGDTILDHGSILLKPYLHQAFAGSASESEVHHAQ